MLVIGFGIYVLLIGLGFLAVIGVAYFIYRDASMRDASEPYPLAWALGSFVIPIIVPVMYLYRAPKRGTRSRPFTTRERLVAWL